MENPEKNKYLPSQEENKAEEIKKEKQNLPTHKKTGLERAKKMTEEGQKLPTHKETGLKRAEEIIKEKKEKIKPKEQIDQKQHEKETKDETESKRPEQQKKEPEKELKISADEAWGKYEEQEVEGLGPTFYDKGIETGVKIKNSTRRSIRENLLKEQDRIKIELAKDWFRKNASGLQDKGVRYVNEEKIENQNYVLKIFTQEKGFEKLKKDPKYKDQYENIRNISYLLKEVSGGTDTPDTFSLTLNALRKRSEGIEDRIKSENATWFEKRALEQEQRKILDTRKEIAEQIMGKKTLKGEVIEEKGTLKAMRKKNWEEVINTLEGSEDFVKEYYKELRNKTREEYEKRQEEYEKRQEETEKDREVWKEIFRKEKDNGNKIEKEQEIKQEEQEKKEKKLEISEEFEGLLQEFLRVVEEMKEKRQITDEEEESFLTIIFNIGKKLLELEKK